MNIKHYLDALFSQRLSEKTGDNTPGVVKQAQRPEFGHYQANGVMQAAKKVSRNPRELAQEVVDELGANDLNTEVAGPGFINIRLNPQFIADEFMASRESLGIEPVPSRRIVVDYSAPNLAKEMHVGHLRTTTIGDALVRILEFLGHDVVRANHVGDWGAQFGSLLAYMDRLSASGEKLSSELRDLEKFYQAASALFKSDSEFAAIARDYVVRLQQGDERCLLLWKQFIEESVAHCQAVYEQFNVTLERSDIRAESAYNDDLSVVVDELQEKELIEEDEGAMCVFLDEFVGKDNKPLPAIIRKSDGGYPYMATDLAAVRYRTQELLADEALYVVGSEQQLHLRQVFSVARAAGYLEDRHQFRHLPFGMVLKPDGSRFKTRDGADVKLIDVLDEAVDRAYRLVSEKNPGLTEETRKEISRVVGIGAVKYAELSKNRATDYIFDWDTMLSFEGNTAPYLQYAYTRIRSIFRRAGIEESDLVGPISLQEETEMRLALKLLQFPEAIEGVLEDYQANVLCNYLFELSGQFMSFYEQCQVLTDDSMVQTTRLLLCDRTARTLRQGLDLLGIETVEQM